MYHDKQGGICELITFFYLYRLSQIKVILFFVISTFKNQNEVRKWKLKVLT